jgi:hypothetical protein
MTLLERELQKAQEDPKQAVDDFTDRESYTNALNSALETLKPGAPLQVLYFYGKGGIGKTTLLNRCLKIAGEKFPDKKRFVSITRETPQGLAPILDFKSIEQICHAEDVLRELFTAFKTCGIDLPDFIYFYDEYQDALARRRKEDLHGPIKAVGFGKSWLETGADLVDGGLAAVTAIPVVGPLLKHAPSVYNSHKDKKAARCHPLFSCLPSLKASPDKFLLVLFSLLGERVSEWLRKNDKVLLLPVDEYERLTDKKIFKPAHEDWGGPDDRDPHLREFFASLQRSVLAVIAGRDKIRWMDNAHSREDFKRIGARIEIHLIGPLSYEDTKSYLSKHNIVEEEVVKAIYDYCYFEEEKEKDETDESEQVNKGTFPLLLDYCRVAASAALNARKKVSRELFSCTSGEDFENRLLNMADRYLKHLDEKMQKAVLYLSVHREGFSPEMAHNMWGGMKLGLDVEEGQSLLQSTVATFNKAYGLYNLPEAVRVRFEEKIKTKGVFAKCHEIAASWYPKESKGKNRRISRRWAGDPIIFFILVAIIRLLQFCNHFQIKFILFIAPIHSGSWMN